MAKERAYTGDDVTKRHIILFAGPGKSGKTTIAYHLFGRENTSILSYDEIGMKSIRPVPSAFVINPNDPWKDTLNTLPELKNLKKQALLVDDLTHMGNMFFRHIRDTAKHSNTLKMYGGAIDYSRQVMEYCKWNLTHMHIIYTCTTRSVTDEDGERWTFPNVIGKDTFAQEIPALVDHLFFVMPPVQETIIPGGRAKDARTVISRKILTSGNGAIIAGNRMNQAGQQPILELTEEVAIEDGSLENIEKLRKKLLGS